MVRWQLSTIIHTVGVAFVMFLGGCGSHKYDSASDSAHHKSDHPFKVALLTPGPISDKSWNGGAYEGLIRIRDSLGAEVSHIQTKTPAEFEENFRQYGAQGYDLVFGHGFEFQDAAARVGPEFPKTTYVVTSGSRTGPATPNVAGMEFGFDEPSYEAGVAAGRVTRSNVLGVIGGTELPPVKKSFAAFERGALSVNPKVKVITSFIGNWDDVSAGKEQALAQIAQRADVIFQNADAAGLGVFQGARDALKSGKTVYVIGSNSNQNSVAPEVTLGSVVIDLPHAFLTVAREVQSGSFKARVITLGAASEVVKWVPNSAVTNSVETNSAVPNTAGTKTAITNHALVKKQ